VLLKIVYLLVVILVFFRGKIAAGGVKSLVVVPGDPFQGGKSDISGAIPRSVLVDEFFLIERKEA